MAEGTVLERRDVVWRDIAGEMVVLDLDSKVVMGLNDTGGGVWERLDGSTSLESIRQALRESFNVSNKEVWADLVELVTDLARANLVERVS
jgi:hypothetical protein